ncbi:MAG TPA: glycosyltransferase [Blastocatellia bacterium]|nr:glycosyltransferase [Blastocatellia bacterium]
MRKKILLICGTKNQTTQMHRIAGYLPDYDLYFTPYYSDGLLNVACQSGLTEFTVMGRKFSAQCLDYLRRNNLKIDNKGRGGPYDLVLTCSDLVAPKNIRKTRVVLVQEGMTDPENFGFRLVKAFPFLPRWIASTAATGLSHCYDRFCVASEGYRDHFVRKGIDPGRVVVTGIPNFDNCSRFLDNDFPHKGYVLVCTSDARETFKFDDRKKFIRKAADIATGRQLIFKLHPNERAPRAEKEIRSIAPDALIFQAGNTEEMIANCDVLITQYSSTVYVGLALGKEVHSYFDIQELRRLLPVQNARAAKNIAGVCRELIEDRLPQNISRWGRRRPAEASAVQRESVN